MKRFLEIIGFSRTEQADLGELERALSTLPGVQSEEEMKYTSGLAGLLSKVAYSDGDISTEEQHKIKALLVERLKLSYETAEKITEIATAFTKELNGIQDYRYSRLLFDCLPEKSDRLKVLECLFLVASVDGEITFEEDRVIGTLATALKLTRQDFINARLPFAEHLSVIKNLPRDK